MSEIVEPITGPELEDQPLEEGRVAVPRLARHRITLDDGHVVGITVAGRGIPLVVVHGFSAEGFLYAQTLSRLVSMGFKVIAIDTAGHGGTQGLPSDGQELGAYSELLGRIVHQLGIRHCILAGHSMGGRLVTQLAAAEPDLAIAVMLIDAIVGDTWDRMVYAFRLAPPLLAGVGAALLVDSLGVVPVFRDPRQAAKLTRLVVPTMGGHVVRPWRLVGPMVSILRSRSSRYALNTLADEHVPVIVLHGDCDVAVPFSTGQQAADRTNGTLVRVEGAGHSWILRDPETLPAIVAELLDGGPLGEACDHLLAHKGLDRRRATVDEVEAACYAPGARVFALTPMSARPTALVRHRQPRFRWSTETIDHDTPDGRLGDPAHLRSRPKDEPPRPRSRRNGRTALGRAARR